MEELVSIITPVYNGEKWIAECIESVQKQTYHNWEMIIVDDNSQDSTLDIINKYLYDSRIKVYTNDSNMKVAFSRNLAIKNSKGRYIAFLDSDDLWLPNKLKKQIEFMKKNDYAFTFTGYEMFKDNGEVLCTIEVPKKVTYHDYLKNTIIGCLTVIIDKKKITNFKSQTGSLEDVKTWLYVLKNYCDAYGLNENLARYRVSNNSISSNKIKNAKLYFDCLKNFEKLNFIKCIYYEFCYLFNAIKKRIK